MFLPSPSIISFQDAYVDYIIPKTYFNDTDKSYYASITTCVYLAHNSNPSIFLVHTYMYIAEYIILWFQL